MKVNLLAITNNAIDLMSDACGICVGKYGEEVSLGKIIKVLRRGHLSIAEHVNLTFHIEDVSRVLMAQLTRHRHASFSIESQRSVDPSDVVVPISIKRNSEAYSIFINTYSSLKENQDKLLKLGIPREDVRYLSPEGSVTNIMLTCNLRALIEISKLRLCNRAQDEIRFLFELIQGLVCQQLGDWINEFLAPDCVHCTNPCRR